MYQIPEYLLAPLKGTAKPKTAIRHLAVGDILAIEKKAVRVISLSFQGIVGVHTIGQDGNVCLMDEHGLEKVTYVRVEDPCLRRVKISGDALIRNGFKDISNHTLKGASTFRYVHPTDDCHVITVKIGDWADCTYFDDRNYHNLESKHISTLEQLQHILDEDGFDLLLNP